MKSFINLIRLWQHIRVISVTWAATLFPAAFASNEVYVGYSAGYVRVSTPFAGYNQLSPLGVSLEYSRSMSPKLLGYAAGEANLELNKKTIVLAGGAVGLGLTLFGGRNIRMESEDIQFQTSPWTHIFCYFAVGQYSYDVTSIVPPPQQSASGVRRKVERIGSFISPLIGLGLNFYSTAEGSNTFGLRAYVRQSLNLDKLSITALAVNATYGLSF